MKNLIRYNRIAEETSILSSPGMAEEHFHLADQTTDKQEAEVLLISPYPPRENGVAVYSYHLVKALEKKFSSSFRMGVCEITQGALTQTLGSEVKHSLNPLSTDSYLELVKVINNNQNLKAVVVQYDPDIFKGHDHDFTLFLKTIIKPVSLVFHTIEAEPTMAVRDKIRAMIAVCNNAILMTHTAAGILAYAYGVDLKKILVIPHGTHLVQHSDREVLKGKYGLNNRKIISTFGLLAPDKAIENMLDAMPSILKNHPETLFLVLGKTHPQVLARDGHEYRNMLENKISDMKLDKHVRFIDTYLPMPELLEYLQLTDIYVSTSRNSSQAVSGTLSYALSCACPVISTPIPFSREILRDNTGMLVDYDKPEQLTEAVNRLLFDDQLRNKMSENGLQKIISTVWENTAITYAMLFREMDQQKLEIQYDLPEINLNHIRRLTTDFGLLQSAHNNQPIIDSGYTLDDNARGLVAICNHHELTRDPGDLALMKTYLNFIKHCLRPGGYFLNYVNEKGNFTKQNNLTNLADANGRAFWALGRLISCKGILPEDLIADAEAAMDHALMSVTAIQSKRAMAFTIKGLYYYNREKKSVEITATIRMLGQRLLQAYKLEPDQEWKWFEGSLSYANSILPEGVLCAFQETGEQIFRDAAKESFDFLLQHTFDNNGIKVISDKVMMNKGGKATRSGEQPVDIAYTIIALKRFYEVFGDKTYLEKMTKAFSWFLGNNHLQQVIYNPCTGGCFDGLEDHVVNLNQGAEATMSYLLARLAVESK